MTYSYPNPHDVSFALAVECQDNPDGMVTAEQLATFCGVSLRDITAMYPDGLIDPVEAFERIRHYAEGGSDVAAKYFDIFRSGDEPTLWETPENTHLYQQCRDALWQLEERQDTFSDCTYAYSTLPSDALFKQMKEEALLLQSAFSRLEALVASINQSNCDKPAAATLTIPTLYRTL